MTAQSASGLVGENKPGQTLRRRHRVGVGDSESTSPEIEDFWCADESRSDSSTSSESQSDSDVRTRASLSLTPAETALPVDSLAESVKCVRQTASGGLSDTSDNVVETGSLGVVRKTESSVMTRDEVSRTTCPRGTSPVSRKSASPVLAHGVRSVRTGVSIGRRPAPLIGVLDTRTTCRRFPLRRSEPTGLSMNHASYSNAKNTTRLRAVELRSHSPSNHVGTGSMGLYPYTGFV